MKNLKPFDSFTSPVKEAETEDPQEITVGDYQTSYFDVCPGASKLYSDTELFDDLSVDEDMAVRSAKLQDALYFIEKHVLESESKDEGYLLAAQNIADQIMAMAKMMGLEKEHGFIQGHVDTIAKAVS